MQNDSEQHWLKRLAPLTARRRLQAREWLLGYSGPRVAVKDMRVTDYKD